MGNSREVGCDVNDGGDDDDDDDEGSEPIP